MIKRTLYFGNPVYLRKQDMQMIMEFPAKDNKPPASAPIEDIGIIVLDSPQITISHALITALCQNNAAIISCDEKHLPHGLMLPMFAHHAFTERMHQQLQSSVPLRKNLWQQTVVAKIANQAALLRQLGRDDSRMQYYLRQVKSGDPHNVEARAAAYYWEHLFGQHPSFERRREGAFPNPLLNYGYAILLSVIARALVASGLLPVLGIHHRNKYNPWCLASDIMEPYRPYVDQVVVQALAEHPDAGELTPGLKQHLLQIPAMDIAIDGKSSPLMVGAQRTTASLSACFEGSLRRILYPEMS